MKNVNPHKKTRDLQRDFNEKAWVRAVCGYSLARFRTLAGHPPSVNVATELVATPRQEPWATGR